MIEDPYNWFTQNQPMRHAPDRTGEALSIYTGRIRFGKVLMAIVGGALAAACALLWR